MGAVRGSVQAVTPQPPAESVDLGEFPYGPASFLGGAANVIMQLSQAPVGYGVVESKVDSGKITLHPVKRLRTTLTYLAVALAGTDADRAAYREAVNTSHAPVRSGPDSPVKYNAFSVDLQLWVAACLYWGGYDLVTRLSGPMDDARADAFYRDGMRLATTLQVPPQMWPADRAAFERYWTASMAKVAIDDRVRAYLLDIVDLKMMPLPVRLLFGRFHRWLVAGVLPQRFRDEMHLAWSESDQRWFDRFLCTVGSIARLLPPVLRAFPLNLYLWDLRMRIKFNRPLV